MPLYEIKSKRDLEIAIARKLPLRVSCCGGLDCCDKDEIIWSTDAEMFVIDNEDGDEYESKSTILVNVDRNYPTEDNMEEDFGCDRYFSEQPLIGKILKRKSL